jgi:hypothetical protein
MKLSIVRGGGIAPIATRTEISSDSLSEADAATLRRKVEDARVLELADAGGQHPEDLLYELTIEDEGRVHTVRLSDSALPDAVRSLIAWADSSPAAVHGRA